MGFWAASGILAGIGKSSALGCRNRTILISGLEGGKDGWGMGLWASAAGIIERVIATATAASRQSQFDQSIDRIGHLEFSLKKQLHR
jgi:hypothetical protein